MCQKTMITPENLALLIIAGGRSSRFGKDKRTLLLGEISLLEHILVKGRTANFAEIFLCAEAPSPFLTKLAKKYEATLLFDEKQGCGPVSGLTKGLQAMNTPWALAVAGDMPFLDLQALCRWAKMSPGNNLALLPESHGRLQPLAAFYRKGAAPFFQTALDMGQRKIRQVLAFFPCERQAYSGSPAHFFNVNTPADFRLAKGRLANLNRRIPLISVIAPASGTGKTTFIEKLLPLLSATGIKAGVVKSDSHGFNLDMQGKDSCRFQAAGAASVAVVSPQGWFMIQNTESRPSLEDIAAKMDGVDLILTESRSHGSLPALSLWRGKGVPLTGQAVAALFTSPPQTETTALYEYDINDMEKALEICLFLMGC